MSGASPPAARVRPHAIVLVPALLVAAAVHGHALGGFFAQDDITFLSRAAGLGSARNLVRPLSEWFAFRIEYGLFGLQPLGYFVVNLALHLLNVVGVYILGLRLSGSRSAAGAASILFGASSIAFTPLHWATGIGDLLTCTLLLGATLLQLESHVRSPAWRWAAALVALAAMLSKETAVAWLLVVLVLDRRVSSERRSIPPALAACLAFGLFFALTGQTHRIESSGAYSFTGSPSFLAQNLFTYLRWSVALHDPVRDRIAMVDPSAWRFGLPLMLALGVGLWWERRTPRPAAAIGVGWWLAFLLPVLPLAHHSYLYYLYIPWAGGAIALGAIGRALLARMPGDRALGIGIVVLGCYAVVEAYNVSARETATRDFLPVDRTVRDATLLSHALPTLLGADLPRGSRILFVNPVPRPRFDLMTGAPTRGEDLARRRPYWPLEGAMRDGGTLRLFAPNLVYVGFATTIPEGGNDAQYFYFEQRGWLRPWGSGQTALMNQAEVQVAARRWAAAESTYRRVRSLGDTIPGALEGQTTALLRLDRGHEADIVAEEYLRRWPDRPAAAAMRNVLSRH